ncbi:MAG: O-methyltransferase [Deltaproteobacteria bacterium]|nr:O-methyltransferase [Deltaproteobacteria bacterium]
MSPMIPDPETYFRRFIPPRDALLIELESEAAKEEIPIVGPVVGELLFLLARVTQARRILELGTATGYSTIYLAGAFQNSEGQLVTLEADEGMAKRAQENFQKAGLAHCIDVRVGDALEEMSGMNAPFDFIFMDIDKEHYIHVLDDCRRLLKTGGLLLADNVGFKDAADFNRSIFDDPHWKCVHLHAFLPQHSPEKDGLCLAVRI